MPEAPRHEFGTFGIDAILRDIDLDRDCGTDPFAPGKP